MKPEEFAQGEPVNLRVNLDVASLVETSPLEKHHMVEMVSAFIPHGQTADPSLAKPLIGSSRRMPFSSSFLQPEQFFAELKVTAGADIRPDLSEFLASRRRSEEPANAGTQVGNHDQQQCGLLLEKDLEPDLESFYEPANSVPTLELSYEGKPAPAPAHLRTMSRITAGIPPKLPLSNLSSSTVVSQTAQPVAVKDSEESSRDSCAAEGAAAATSGDSLQGSLVLQKSSSRGSSGRFHKMRETLVRSLSGGRENSAAGIHEIEACEGNNGGKQSGRGLRRMLRWGASMEFLKLLGNKKPSASKTGNPNPSFPNLEQRIEAASQDPEVVDDDGGSSPASSVSTTYSEVSSKSQSYKHSHKKSLKSEVVKSKLWVLRVHQKLRGLPSNKDSDDDEGDGIYEALRQGAMDPVQISKEEAADSLGVLNAVSISKLVAKHKRNSTWDAGKQQLSSDHIFSPKQPRLPSRDAHVLLAPPKRLITGDTAKETELAKPSRLIVTESSSPMQVGNNETVNPTTITDGQGIETRLPPLPSQEQTSLETLALKSPRTTGPAKSSEQSTSVSPITLTLKSSPTTGPAKSSEQSASVSPIRVELPTPPMSPRTGSSAQRSSFPGFSPPLPLPVRARSSQSPELRATSPGVPKTPTRRRYAAAGSPGGGELGIQSSLIAGWDATSPRMKHHPVEPFSLEESPSSSLAQVRSHTRARSVAQQEVPIRSHSRSDSAIATARNGVNGAKPQELPTSTEGNAVPLPRLQGLMTLSFEQIVAGRGRSPPTDNTLMKFFFKCREIDSLNKFLALQKRRFLDSSSADSEKCFHMIMSEAGAGLSSMISTICTAWLLENTMASATSRVWHPVPVLNMSQQDMWNHRDAAWLFHVCGIDANAVLFRDEITPSNEAVISGRVKRAVIGQDILVIKPDEVASCCTIVSEKFRQEAPKFLQARYMMTLLLAGILVDTNNLSSGSSRDKQQATILLVGAGSLGRNGFYNHLMNIRDEDYVTMFIKEIYGESNALTGEKPAQLAQGIEQSETKGATMQNDEKPERPPSLAASKVSSQVSAPVSPSPVPSQKPTTKLLSSKSENESKRYDDMKDQSLSRNQSPHAPARAPQNSKISLALRRLRSRPSAAQ